MGERGRILVVDDDRTLLEMAEEIIGDDYDVALAESGEQALEILGSGDAPELIILDIEMPGMDGFETLNRIREIPPLAEIPVIFLTGRTGSEAELAGLKLGAQDYITKPFARENLVTRIRLRIESGQQARQLRKIFELSEKDEALFITSTRGLTLSEREVARLIAQGFGNQEIAQYLHYSSGYVKNLATLIYEKLGVGGRKELRTRFQKYPYTKA